MSSAARAPARPYVVPAVPASWATAARLLPLLVLALLVPVYWFPWRWPLLTLVSLPLIPAVGFLQWRVLEGRVTRTGLEWPLAALLACTCLATIPVVDWRLALPKVLGMVLSVSAVVAIGGFVTSRRAVARGLIAGAVLALLVAAVGLVGVEWSTDKYPVLAPIYGRLPALIRGVPNSRTGGINPNQLGGVLVLILPVLLAQGLVAGRSAVGRLRRFGGLAIGVAGIAVLVLTQSRSALAGMSVAVAVLGGVAVARIARRRHWPEAVRFVVPVVYLSLIALLAVAELDVAARWLRLVSADSMPGDTLNGRLELWHYGVRLLREAPLQGIGISQVDPAIRARYTLHLVPTNEYIAHVHNLFLEYALELGLLGLGAFLWLLVVYFRRGLEAARATDPLLRWTSLGLMLGVLAHLVYGLTDAIAPGARGGLLFWVVVAFGTAVANVAIERSPSPGDSSDSAGLPHSP